MESLSSILGRAMAQRPHEAQQAPGGPNQGARSSSSPQQTSQLPANTTQRRPLPEQTGRMGRQYPTNQQRSLPPHAHLKNAQAAQNRAAGNDPYAQRTRAPQQNYQHYDELPATRPPYTRQQQQLPADVAPTHYQPRPRPKQDMQRVQPMPSLPPNTYYHTDDHGPALPADVYQEQDIEEDEEVGRGMLYGGYLDDEDEEEEDFYLPEEEEVEEGEEVPVYRREDMAHLPAPRNNYPQITRNIAAPAPTEMRTRPTRDLRTLTTGQQPLSQLPQGQEVARYNRHTQPLKPQMIAHMQRERDFSPEQPLVQQPQHLSRQLVTREKAEVQLRAPERFTTIPTSSITPVSARAVCPRCRGAGYLRLDVPFGHPNFGRPIACECKEAERKEKRRQQLREMSNLDAFHSQTFRTFNPRVPGVQEAFQVAVAYAQNPEGWLLLVGPNGCGKTHLAASIANKSLDNGSVVLFSVVPDLLDHLRAAFAPNATEVYDQLFAKMREAEVLVLDDLGAQQSSPWATEKLFQLLNYRYNLGMPTVITANPRGVQGIDERIRSRLTDVSLVMTVNLDRSRDYRPNRPRRRD